MNLFARILGWLKPVKKPVAPTPAPAPAPEPWSPSDLVALLNAERAKFGQRPLVDDPKLEDLAQSWADTIAEVDKLDHGDFWKRVASVFPGQDAEDIAENQHSAKEVADAWMASPSHRSNILGVAYRKIGSVAYRKIGIGRAVSKTGNIYYVADFAS